MSKFVNNIWSVSKMAQNRYDLNFAWKSKDANNLKIPIKKRIYLDSFFNVFRQFAQIFFFPFLPSSSTSTF